MGLLTTLLLLPVLGPVKGLVFVLEKIKEQVDAEQLDEGLVEEALVLLSLRYDLGELSAEDFAAQEDDLMARLNAIRAYKEGLSAQNEEDDGEEVPSPSVTEGEG